MRNLFLKFRKSEDGATLVEYGVALIVAIIVGGTALTQLASATQVNMDAACDSVIPGAVTGVAVAPTTGASAAECGG